MLRLRNVAPAVKFRADLPEWLGKGAFIEIDARPSGPINTAFMAAQDEVTLAHLEYVRAVKDEARALDAGGEVPQLIGGAIKDRVTASRAFVADLTAAIYDTCVIEWRTNLVDGVTDVPLTCDRNTFIELSVIHVPEVQEAFAAFQEQIKRAGLAVIADTEATIKN